MTESSSGRRSNAQRSSDTRSRILNAAVDCLIEDGYAATSVGAIQTRAGVSRGALLHQYPSKAGLVVDAVRHIADRQTSRLLAHASSNGSDTPSTTLADPLEWFDDLWRHFTTPVFGAVLELWVAARTDPDLRQSLLPYEQQLGRTLRELALGDGAPATPQFNQIFEMTLTYFRGLALTTILSSREHRDYLLTSWRQTVATMLATDVPPVRQA